MTDATTEPEKRRPRMRLAFRVRSLLLLILLVALAFWGHKQWQRQWEVDLLIGLLPQGVLVGIDGDGVMLDGKGNALQNAVRKVQALRGEALAVSRLRATLRQSHLDRDPNSDPAALRIYRTNKAAMAALEWLGPDARPAVPELIQILEESHSSHLRAMAAQTLPRIGGDDPRVIDALTRALAYQPRDRSQSGIIASAAARGLFKLAQEIDLTTAVPALARLLEHPDQLARVPAAQTLGQIGPDARAAVPALIEALEDEDAFVRGMAVFALGEIATDGYPPPPTPLQDELVPVLTPLLEDSSSYVQTMARQTLGRFQRAVEIQRRREEREALIAAEHAQLQLSNAP